MKVDIKETINGYIFHYQAEKLIVKVSRLRLHSSDGRVTGELLISNNDNQPLYPSTSINFTADRTRNSLAKTLSELDTARPWVDIIKHLSLTVVEMARKGKPVQELWTSDNVPELEYLLEPVLIKGVPTIIFGEKGVTKSILALIIYFCLVLPWADNPLGFTASARSVKTLILDYELPGYIAQRNAKLIQEGMGLPPIPLFHRRCAVPLADEVEQVASYIANLNAEVVIIDSLARACGGDLIKTEPANAFFEALDKLNVTSLIIAQTSKDVETKRKTIYGNALFTYYARSIFELCKTETLQDDVLNVALFHRWANLTRLHPDMGFRLTFNQHKTIVESQPVSITEFLSKVNTQKVILNELKDGALSVKDLAERIERTPSQVSPLLTKLKKKGLVVNLDNNKWGLCQREL